MTASGNRDKSPVTASIIDEEGLRALDLSEETARRLSKLSLRQLMEVNDFINGFGRIEEEPANG